MVDPTPAAAGRRSTVAALRALREWDGRRAAAYARGDLRTLRRLYIPGSTAATADVRLLRSYLARGLVVAGMRTQLLDVDVLRRTGSSLRLRVEDRVVGASVQPAGRRPRTGGPVVVLPADLPTVRVLVLVREAGDPWRARSVREVSGARQRAGR